MDLDFEEEDLAPPAAAAVGLSQGRAPAHPNGHVPNGVHHRQTLFAPTQVPPAAKPDNPVSVTQINAAIQSIQNGQSSTPPQQSPRQAANATPSRPRVRSPMELMMAGQAVPKPSPAPTPQPKPTLRPLPPAPAPASPDDIWAPAAPLSDAEKAQLDQESLAAPTAAKAGVQGALNAYLSETKIALDSLRTSLETLRGETQRLDARRRETREKIGERIDAIQDRLEELKPERG